MNSKSRLRFRSAQIALPRGIHARRMQFLRSAVPIITAFVGLCGFCSTVFAGVGDPDPKFDPAVRCPELVALAVQGDGKILLGGEIESDAKRIRGTNDRCSLLRLNSDGTLDKLMKVSANGLVSALLVLNDGEILMGGSFTGVSGTAYLHLAKRNSDGSADDSFHPSPNGNVNCMALQADGGILIGGEFSNVGIFPRKHIARMNAGGTIDANFHPEVEGPVYGVAVQEDQKIMIGGTFTGVGGKKADGIARLNPDGSMDTEFKPVAVRGCIYSVAIQADGKILIGGDFPTLNHLVRLKTTGEVDGTFSTRTDFIGNTVRSMAIQSDGKVLAGGGMIHRLPGKRQPGVNYIISSAYVALVQMDGREASIFKKQNVKHNSPAVSTVGLQADGQILVAGDPNGTQHHSEGYIMRLSNEPAIQSLNIPDSTQVQWTRGGTAPEVSQVIFEVSTDGMKKWGAVGFGKRVGASSNWQITGASLPQRGVLRARGRTANGGTGSGVIEQMQNYALDNAPKPGR